MLGEVKKLIDTYGANLKRWPDAVAGLFPGASADAETQEYLKEARRIDKALANWTEDEDGARIEDEDGEPDEEPGEGDDEGEGDEDGGEDPFDDDHEREDDDSDGDSDGDGGGDEVDGGGEAGESLDTEYAPPPELTTADIEAIEALEAALEDIEDTDAMMAEVIGRLVKTEYSDQKFLEYTRDFDRIEPIEVAKDIDVEEIEEQVRKVSSVIQKDLQRIITARSQSVFQPGLRRGRLNPSALHRIEIEDDRLFRKKVTNESKDVAITLLVDFSGSMRGPRIRLALMVAWCFAEVLDRLNINSEVIGFTCRRPGTYGDHMAIQAEAAKFAKSVGADAISVRWEALNMPIIKGFGERFTLEQKKRIATAWTDHYQRHNLDQNIDGACLKTAAIRLLQQRQVRKMLIVLSDGEPCSYMHGGVLHTHLHDTVKEVTAAGIDLVGVGIQTDSANRFYPKSFRVNNLGELPSKVVGELKRFLTQ